MLDESDSVQVHHTPGSRTSHFFVGILAQKLYWAHVHRVHVGVPQGETQNLDNIAK